MILLPYFSFVIFTLLIFFLINDVTYEWFSDNCSSSLMRVIIISLIVGCACFIWTCFVIIYIKEYYNFTPKTHIIPEACRLHFNV